jgi:hypothetical protein
MALLGTLGICGLLRSAASTNRVLVGALFTIPLLLGLAILSWALNRHGTFVAISPAGLRVRTPTCDRLVPWHEVGDTSETASVGAALPSGALVEGREGAPAIEIHWVFEGSHEIRQFCQAVQAARKRYASRRAGA